MKKKRKGKYFYVFSRNLDRVIKVNGSNKAYKISKEGSPEYIVGCPKYGCIIGVN